MKFLKVVWEVLKGLRHPSLTTVIYEDEHGIIHAEQVKK